jgi:hypothetical protein
MVKDLGLQTHSWTRNHTREIKIDGRRLLLYCCPRCQRHFAREPGQPDWRAAHVGVFQVDFLEDSVTRQWVSEPCPGELSDFSSRVPSLIPMDRPIFSKAQVAQRSGGETLSEPAHHPRRGKPNQRRRSIRHYSAEPAQPVAVLARRVCLGIAHPDFYGASIGRGQEVSALK